jgi:tRNA threonylcarbamoyladenosine biosynthesis protein TsaE
LKLPLSKIVLSITETSALAEEFSEIIVPGDVLAVNGNLGAGKTFFIQNILNNFGIKGVNSPTFAIVNQYDGKYKINHFDFYRINKVTELYDIGFEDYLNMDEAITFIEWANLIPEIIPQKRTEILIHILGETERKFEIKKIN